MNAQNQVPSEISEIIERKRAALLEERRQKEEADQQKRAEQEAKGKAIFDEKIQKNLLDVPEWIRPYFDPSLNIPDYARIAVGYDIPERMHMYFHVPGLAVIGYDPHEKQWQCETADDADAYYNRPPRLQFSNSSYWRGDLEYTLGVAQKEMQEYEQYVAQYQIKQDERAKQEAKKLLQEQHKEEHQRELEARGELESQKQEREEQALFDAIKNDAVAMNMLKAFILIREERTSFTQQIENADWALYNMEERHSRHAAELRRQADEVERRAEDEKARLQSDLDDAESKLKKAQRGW